MTRLLHKLTDTLGAPTHDFLKRWIAFMIGGTTALIVELVLYPVKARTHLVESLAAALEHINEMERYIAAGIEKGAKIDVYAATNVARFETANAKANTALSAAETFLPFCSKEPRIKGSFEGLALIYTEILFVLHQIVDRMDNMLQLQTSYGSGPLEELNADIYPYRRNVAGSITSTLFALHSALTTKVALPQFLPSARLAHLRMINRVREVVLEKVGGKGHDSSVESVAKLLRQRAVRRKYMSWNATSAAQAEIIEFLEELIDLTKMLVGAHEFKSGLLTRTAYLNYAGGNIQTQPDAAGGKAGDDDDDEELEETALDSAGMTALARGTTLDSIDSRRSELTRRRRGSRRDSEDVPASLRRIQTRKLEAGMRRQQTNESEHRGI